MFLIHLSCSKAPWKLVQKEQILWPYVWAGKDHEDYSSVWDYQRTSWWCQEASCKMGSKIWKVSNLPLWQTSNWSLFLKGTTTNIEQSTCQLVLWLSMVFFISHKVFGIVAQSGQHGLSIWNGSAVCFNATFTLTPALGLISTKTCCTPSTVNNLQYFMISLRSYSITMIMMEMAQLVMNVLSMDVSDISKRHVIFWINYWTKTPISSCALHTQKSRVWMRRCSEGLHCT